MFCFSQNAGKPHSLKGVFTYRIKLEELSILSCKNGPRPKAQAFFTAKDGEPRGF